MATPEMRPGLGQISITDDFSSDTWATATSDHGSAAINNNQMTLTAQAGYYMTSIRQDSLLTNYYAEITAVAGYRFALSCDGTVHADLVSVGSQQKITDPIPSSDAPKGAPGKVRIGVWAVGTELRLFLNGHYQFSINDPKFKTGTIGVFVFAASDTPVAVVFSNLVVQNVNFAFPTSTPLPTKTPRP
jgi:hypothetical protein